MNSNFGKNFEFDLGFGSNRSTSLNEKKNRTPSYSSSGSNFSSSQPKPAWQPNRPSWTHQPAPNLANGPVTMVGDISGKTWGSTVNSGSNSGIGIIDKNPNLFGDLLNSALGQGKNNSNVPLKNATPPSLASSNKNTFSMGNIANSLPKTGSSSTNVNRGSSDNFGSYTSGSNNFKSNVVNNNKSSNLGGPSIRSMGGVGSSGMSSNKDPFVSLVDFGSKQSGGLNSSSNKGDSTSKKVNEVDDAFGDFKNAPKSSTNSFESTTFNGSSNAFTKSKVDYSNVSDFGMPDLDFASMTQAPVQPTAADPLDMLFSTSSAPKTSEVTGGKSEIDDWGLDSGFGGGSEDAGGSTTELEGLPPPPAGVTSTLAKDKGMDNYKQGQYADAIKWLSWAVILIEKSGNDAATMEVLSSRASCYKEVGEYKKAVADCTKVLERNEGNVSVLVQRALLYESMEKYKLGAEDLRTVLKIDPSNRLAKSTIHRLTKMAG